METGVDVCFINVYAPCSSGEKRDLWDRLKIVVQQNVGACICVGGDFNSILRGDERVGRGTVDYRREVRVFREFVEESELLDLPIQGRKFTCYKSDGSCKSRIDRVLVNDKSLGEWPDIHLVGLKRTISDHCPILVEAGKKDWGPRPFRSIKAWFSHHLFKNFVADKWEATRVEGWGGFVLHKKLKCLRGELKIWNKEVFGNLDRIIEKRKSDIWILDIIDDALGLEEEEIINRNKEQALLLRDLKNKKSLMAQKAKVKWIRDGDENSAIFHRFINGRRKRSEIPGIEAEGEWVSEPGRVKLVIFNKFKAHFQGRNLVCLKLVGDSKIRTVSETEKRMMIESFTEEEVWSAVKGCSGGKSLGPDGFDLSFYKGCWEVIRNDFLRFVQEFYENGWLAMGLNSSFITLMPKGRAGTDLNCFRPISLISGPYKILSKMLVHRLKAVMDGIISDTQSAFIGRRQIVESVVILNEVIEHFKSRREGGFCYKIDFEKAYDSVRWDFLVSMMGVLNFDEKWTGWIRECISTARASVLVNGSPTKEFCLERGLRQGDPLSPFLFLIVAESINILMRRAVERKMFEPVHIGNGGCWVSHLQYADDTVFVGKVCLKNALFLKRFLILLELATGLRINVEKCSMIGVKAEAGTLADMVDILNCQVGKTPFKYLGMMVGCRHSRERDWSYVIDKVRNRLGKWRHLKLSLSGRITLVKSVLCALPTYVLSVFRAPLCVINKLHALQRNFLWGGGGESEKKLAWVKWAEVCKSKSDGGLGVLDLGKFNKALLGKWGWKGLEGGKALWWKVLCARFKSRDEGCFGGDMWEGSRSRKGWWGSILLAMVDEYGSWFKDGIRKRVGDGKNTWFWDEDWLGGGALRGRFHRLFMLSCKKRGRIADMGRWVDGNWVWDWEWRRGLRGRDLSEFRELCLLLNRCNFLEGTKDLWFWRDEKCTFSVKDGYGSMYQNEFGRVEQDKGMFAQLWNCGAIAKARTCAWRVIRRKIPTRVELQKRQCLPDSVSTVCPLCGEEEESVEHVLFECVRVAEIWDECKRWMNIMAVFPRRPNQHFVSFMELFSGKKRKQVCACLWVSIVWLIWNGRNACVFNGVNWNARKIVDECKIRSWFWLGCNSSKFFSDDDFQKWVAYPWNCV